jgi:DNA-binding MarR family transcriptional regulator
VKQAVKQVASRTFDRHDPDLPPGAIIGILLKSLTHTARQNLDEAFRSHGMRVSFAHVPAMFHMKCEPGIAGAQLARRMSVTAQSMHTILKRLERQGYIERQPHPHNRRAECWYVTRTGFKQLDLAREAAGEVWSRMLSGLTRPEVSQLEDLLERCLVGLGGRLMEQTTAAPQRK